MNEKQIKFLEELCEMYRRYDLMQVILPMDMVIGGDILKKQNVRKFAEERGYEYEELVYDISNVIIRIK